MKWAFRRLDADEPGRSARLDSESDVRGRRV